MALFKIYLEGSVTGEILTNEGERDNKDGSQFSGVNCWVDYTPFAKKEVLWEDSVG